MTDEGRAEGDTQRAGLDRRTFLRSGGLSAAAAYLTATTGTAMGAPGGGDPSRTAPGNSSGGRTRVFGPSFTRWLRRRDDFLHLRFDFYNLRVHAGSPAELHRANPNAAAFIVVHFVPQALAEEAVYSRDPEFDDSDNMDETPVLPMRSRVSGGSRLAFALPDGIGAIPFTPETLLNWQDLTPQLVPVALPPGPLRGRPQDPIVYREPGPLDTALELPWWLLLSPHARSAWAHALDPVTRDGVTELWHTRLAALSSSGEVDEDNEALRAVRAVWTRDPGFADYLDDPSANKPLDGESFPQPTGTGLPFRMSMSPRDRYDIVTSTSDYPNHVSGDTYVPKSVDVDRLFLTALGGWLDSNAVWNAGPLDKGQDKSGIDLESWRHRMSLGRDHYVRIVRKGYLLPTGHPAVLIKVTERRFRTLSTGGRGGGKRVALLHQRYFIVVRQRVRTYGHDRHPHQGRELPFTEIRINTLTTPTLDPPGQTPEPFTEGGTKLFVPRIAGQPFRFQMDAVDHAGVRHDFTSGAVFISEEIAFKPRRMNTVRYEYEHKILPTDPVRQVIFGGAGIALAAPDDPGDTETEVQTMSWGAEQPTGTPTELGALDLPLFLPRLAEASVRLGAAEAILGEGLGELPVVVMDPDYVTGGFGPGEVFVQLKDWQNPTFLDFGGAGRGDRSGGVATPNLGVTALSRKLGAVSGDPKKTQDGVDDPHDLFASLDAPLLGDISLADVVQEIDYPFDLGNEDHRKRRLQITSRPVGSNLETRLLWTPKVKSFADLFLADLDGAPATLTLDALIVTPSGDPGQSTTKITGDLRNFRLQLVGPSEPAKFLEIRFDRLAFVAETGKKTDVDVAIREVVFAGVLEFVNELKDYMQFGGASGPSIELQPTQVKALYGIPLPSITVGVFSLQNISLQAGLTIPFTGQPVRARFGFCTIENPFLLTVMWFGGGGFFELGIGPDGVETLQAALEFGGALSLDVGVASGSVELMAGIYFAMGLPSSNNPEGRAELTGYVRLKGELRVMGIVSLTLTFKMSLTYVFDQDKAVGKATMTVEIQVLVFSGSVTIEVERKFGGSNDPTFGQVVTSQGQWDTYCDAFAPIGA